jgi:hypothetical protein
VITDALALTVRGASFGLAIAGLEHVASRRAFTTGHPMARSVISLLHRRPLQTRWDSCLMTLLSVQVVSASWLALFGPANSLGAIALLLLLATVLAVQWRRTLGGDGAEQMSILIVLAATFAFVPIASDTVARIGALFVVAQLMLSYVTAGAVKVVSPTWRREPILARILATHRFGSAGIAQFLQRQPRLCVLAQWSVIGLELTFPLALVLPLPGLLAYLAAGVCFHVACAVLMGLNTFLWAFPATYPCVYAVWTVWSPAS